MLIRYFAFAFPANVSIVLIAIADGADRRSDQHMGLGRSDYLALTDTRTRKAAGESWLEMLRQWLVQCPQCSEVRLVVGAHENDQYFCKDCGHSFFISRSIAPKSNPLL